MPQAYWYHQTIDQPLFPELLWSRPENRVHAGKLLVIGGNAQGFAAAADAYRFAQQAGAGTTRVLLPDALQKLVSRLFAAGEFAPSTPSGSFSRQALAVLLDDAAWADGVLLAGELGHNSETAVMLEQFIKKYTGQLTITRDAIDYFTTTPHTLLSRPDTTLVLSLEQLQKLYKNSRQTVAITSDMDLVRLVDSLHDFTTITAVNIITRQADSLIVASARQVSTTKLSAPATSWRLQTAAGASVWWLQNPGQTFQALTTSVTITQ